MKKYIAIILLLIAVGVVLGFFTFKENQQLEEEVHIKTNQAIRNMKLLDNSLNVLLFKARYGLENNYDKIAQIINDLSEEFDYLRYTALFEEIEQNEALNQAVINYDEQSIIKQDLVESFKTNNAVLINSSRYLPILGEQMYDIAKKLKDGEVKQNISDINLAVYKYMKTEDLASKQQIVSSLLILESYNDKLKDNEKILLSEYISHLRTITERRAETQAYMVKAVEQPTGRMLNEMEEAYAAYHNNQLAKANKLLNALIIYGFVLLGTLMFFAYLLRKNYLGLEQQVAQRTEQIEQAYNQLKESQEQLIQSEKMASLGEMVAGVAHEINTPLGYVNSNVDTLQFNLSDMKSLLASIESLHNEIKKPERDSKKISLLLKVLVKTYSDQQVGELYTESQELLKDSSHGLSEISNLVLSLKDFARLDRQTTDQINVHDCIENSLKIACNHTKENNVTIDRNYSELPKIQCMPSKLNQLFLNVITNATQAMKENGGELNIITSQHADNVIIDFVDQGIGMDEETLQKMFDPFFTTKPIGEGTGLGMSIAYKIVQSHGGKISAISEEGKGSTITISLPVNSPTTEETQAE